MTFPVGSAISQSLIRRFHQNDLLPISLPQKAISYQRHCLKVAPNVFDTAYSWVELADWIPSVLAGVEDPLLVKRGICAAGHKALYSDE